MTRKSAKELLEGAYVLGSTKANTDYYRDFSATYDSGFADAMGYDAPRQIAAFFQKHAIESDAPIADIGCGTGLVGEHLTGQAEIDGYDLSQEMLDVAHAKNLYRNLYSTDLTQPITKNRDSYGAIISAGTFTHGHLGPADLWNCLSLVRPNGFCAITINAAHYDSSDFEEFFKSKVSSSAISTPIIETAPIYSTPDHDHSADLIHLVGFRLLATA